MVLLEDNEADRIHVKNGTLHLKFKYYIAMGRLTPGNGQKGSLRRGRGGGFLFSGFFSILGSNLVPII